MSQYRRKPQTLEYAALIRDGVAGGRGVPGESNHIIDDGPYDFAQLAYVFAKMPVVQLRGAWSGLLLDAILEAAVTAVEECKPYAHAGVARCLLVINERLVDGVEDGPQRKAAEAPGEQLELGW